MNNAGTGEIILKEFPKSTQRYIVSTELQKDGPRFRLTYRVSGNLDDVLFPPFSEAARGNNLWRETCFEFFIAEEESLEYFEFNFSPSGKWNAYSFISHREGMKEEKVNNIRIKSARKKNNIVLEASFTLPYGKNFSRPEIQLAAILKTEKNVRHFFAIENSDLKPDFHDRQYFLKIF